MLAGRHSEQSRRTSAIWSSASSLRVKDLPHGDKLKFLTDEDQPVAHVTTVKEEVVAAPEAVAALRRLRPSPKSSRKASRKRGEEAEAARRSREGREEREEIERCELRVTNFELEQLEARTVSEWRETDCRFGQSWNRVSVHAA